LQKSVHEIHSVWLEYQWNQMRIVKFRNGTGKDFIGSVAAHWFCLRFDSIAL